MIENRGFDSCQGERFLGLRALQCRVLQLNLYCHCEDLSEINVKKIF
jgi:hypothetical protein